MAKCPYLPVLELTRGEIVESVHFGAFVVVNSYRELIASHGDPDTRSFLRSSAKPFQALPFIEASGHIRWGFAKREIAIMCASHTGTDDHFTTLLNMQQKINVNQEDLLCGIHPPVDLDTRESLIIRGENPTTNRHNCSGKHTGMLAHAKLIKAPIENYIDPEHPVQKRILKAFSEICDFPIDEIDLGIDGCSAPVFAVPLFNAAYGYARLCDPREMPPKRAAACRTISDAMMSHPDMVSGPGTFDTRLMKAAQGKIVSKGGAEGYQQIGIMPGVIKPGSPGIGLALKISDGDPKSRARPALVLEILRQLNAITDEELHELSDYGPNVKVKNWRGIIVGQGYPIFGK
jgi:L-asparaginase II